MMPPRLPLRDTPRGREHCQPLTPLRTAPPGPSLCKAPPCSCKVGDASGMVRTQRGQARPLERKPRVCPTDTHLSRPELSQGGPFSYLLPQLQGGHCPPSSSTRPEQRLHPSPLVKALVQDQGCTALVPSPHPGRPCQGGHPAPRGRASRVTSWAGATRNHPDPEPPGRLSSHQACQAEDDLPAPRGEAGR